MTDPRLAKASPGASIRILAVWFSRTGSTESVVRQASGMLRGLGHTVTEAPLVPRVELPYLADLALSFWPGARVPLREPIPDPAGFEACLLALPSSAVSCPAVNAFLALRGATLPPTALLATCNGWGGALFLRSLHRRLERRGVPVLGRLAVKRNLVYQNKTIVDLRLFLAGCFPAPRPDGT